MGRMVVKGLAERSASERARLQSGIEVVEVASAQNMKNIKRIILTK